ncbi:MAG: galactokinase family protein [Anaerolineae bacterium]
MLRTPEGEVLGVVEHKDVVAKLALSQVRQAAANAVEEPDVQVRRILREAFPNPEKAAATFGRLWQRITDERPISAEEILELVPAEQTVFHMGNRLGPHITVPPEEAARSDEANRSVYLVKAPALYYALSQLRDDNAQREEYLSDIINILAQSYDNGRPRFRVRTLTVTDPHLVMGFNNPAELLEIENLLRSRRAPQAELETRISLAYQPISTWQERFRASAAGDSGDSPLDEELRCIYGSHPGLINERRTAYRDLLDVCANTLGPERPVLLARAPGRINMLGRHIDHQGGQCNLMSIDREVLIAAALRDDDEVHLYNLRPDQFAPRKFSMNELLAELTWDDWLSLVNSDQVRQMVVKSSGDWAQYVRAAFLRLQKHYTDIKLRGLDLVFHGTVPVAAGLSSSSAVVVATAEAIVALNGLNVRPRQFVDLCGEGEWFVGTRGGAADHAAMKFARRDAVINVGFLPFIVGEATPFPKGYRLVFCNSHIRAQKAAAAREVFNQRIACYYLGVQIVRQLYPQFAPLIFHLRDINTRQLPVRLVDLYRMLLKLPERATREELRVWLPEDTLQKLIGQEAGASTEYPIRGVVLYGLAECERARLCPHHLRTGDMAGLGQLMCISHDGDRVSRYDEHWQAYPYLGPTTNAYLLDLMTDLESGVPDRVLAAQLHMQPGAYGCSMPELDLIVDIALRTDGVMGAQLAGAGLGGGIMVLAREETIPQLEEELTARYYRPRGLEPAILPSVPIAGSGILSARGGAITE